MSRELVLFATISESKRPPMTQASAKHVGKKMALPEMCGKHADKRVKCVFWIL